LDTKILVCPGIGDIYWVLVKLEAFLKERGIEKPKLFTWEGAHPERERSSGYIKRVPFVEYGGTYPGPTTKLFQKQYIYGNEWLFEDFKAQPNPAFQFDLVFIVNGLLRNGYSLECAGLGEYETNWHFDLTPCEEEDYREILGGDYLIGYFSEEGMYQTHWLPQMPAEECYEVMKKINQITGLPFVLVGREWDLGITGKLMKLDSQENGGIGCLKNLASETNIDQFFALMKQSKGMFGFPSGATIKSTFFKKPTFMMWSRYFPEEGFYHHCVNPESFGDWYDYELVENYGALKDDIVARFIDLLENQEPIPNFSNQA